MKQLAKLLTGAADQIEGSLHPRINITWQTPDMVYTNVYSVDIPDSVVGKKANDVYVQDEQMKALDEAKHQVLRTGQTHHGTYTMRLTNEEKARVYDTTVQAVKNESGEITALMSVALDMTDIHEAQKQLREANERLVLLLDQVLDSPVPSTAPRKRS